MVYMCVFVIPTSMGVSIKEGETQHKNIQDTHCIIPDMAWISKHIENTKSPDKQKHRGLFQRPVGQYYPGRETVRGQLNSSLFPSVSLFQSLSLFLPPSLSLCSPLLCLSVHGIMACE